jgi:hypothetical protein
MQRQGAAEGFAGLDPATPDRWAFFYVYLVNPQAALEGILITGTF